MGDHDGAFSNRAKNTSSKLIDKMAEGVVIFLFAFGLLNGELEFALNFSHEKVVDNNIVSWLIKFIPDLHYFEFVLH